MLAVAIAAAVLPSAAARDIYVDNLRGDDARDGSEASGPCLTIRRALRLARSGDRIVIENTGEPYRESITLQGANHGGITGYPFRIEGNGAVLDGSGQVPADAWDHHAGDIYRFRPPKLRHQILYLDSKPAERVKAGRVLPQLKPLQWCLFEGHVYFRTEPQQPPRGYTLRHTVLPVGITLYETRHVDVRDLVVQGFQLDGVNAHDGVTHTLLVGLICRGNGRSGVSIGGASRVKLRECIVGDNGVAQVRTEGFCKAEIIDCDLLDHTAPALIREGGQVTRNVQ